ncbi:MAG: hypothetical protein KKA07_04325, partial [Bacteroidetes bacterium]|nr:hypothetical protein [Bacteroidota bacterium]
MLIAGTGGLGKEIMGFLIDDGVPASEITFFDESQNGEEKLFGQFRIIRSGDELKDFLTSQPEFIVGIGHPRIREEVVLRIEKAGGKLVSAISAKAHIFHYNEKPEGIII